MVDVIINGQRWDLDEYLEGSHKNKTLTPEGGEVLDPTPIAPPIGYTRTPSLSEQIRMMVRSEKLAQEARDAGHETFEEADDFDIGEDYEPNSPYQANFDPMTESERAALNSRGKDVDRILPQEEKKPKSRPTRASPVSDDDASSDPSGDD